MIFAGLYLDGSLLGILHFDSEKSCGSRKSI